VSNVILVGIESVSFLYWRSTMVNKVISKYRNISPAIKASVWFTICGALQKGISLLTTPIFTRLLTTAQYGTYSVYQSWYQVISIFATLNLFYGVYNNGMTKYTNDRKRFTSSMQGLSTTITVGLFIVYLCAHDFWNSILDLSTLFVVTMFVELLFVPAFNFWSASQRYDYKYRGIVIVSIIISISTPILGIIAVINTEYKAEARIISVALVQAIVGLIFYIYNFYNGRHFFDKSYWKFALAFNLPLIPHYLSSVILSQADRLMINSMIGKEEAALYAVAYNIALMMNIVVSSVNNSFTPYMYKALKSKQYDGIRNTANLLLSFIGLMCIFAMALGPEIIIIFASRDYQEAIWVVPPVASAVYFTFLYPLFSNVEFYFEKTKFVMIASCIGAIVNIFLNRLLIPIYGYYAAAYTTLFCYILFSFAHYFFARKIVKKNLNGYKIFDIKKIITISVFVLIAMIFMTLLYPYRLIRYIVCFVVLIAVIYLGKKLRYKKR
jgi:O-antigen/teichoic acid export membrane protein